MDNLFTISNISLIEFLAFLISVFALIATLRKKEFGKFVYVEINNKNVRNDVWVKIIKSDIYDISFKIKSNLPVNSRVKLFYPDKSETVLYFLSDNQFNFKISELKSSEKIEFTNFNFQQIKISFTDKYNNKYSQILYGDKIKKRYHLNFWNLTFVGS